MRFVDDSHVYACAQPACCRCSALLCSMIQVAASPELSASFLAVNKAHASIRNPNSLSHLTFCMPCYLPSVQVHNLWLSRVSFLLRKIARCILYCTLSPFLHASLPLKLTPFLFIPTFMSPPELTIYHQVRHALSSGLAGIS